MTLFDDVIDLSTIAALLAPAQSPRVEQQPRFSIPSMILPTMLSKPSYRRQVSPKRSAQRSNFTGGNVA
jgi:hypothetical protein